MSKRGVETRKEPFKSHFRRYWQLYAMMVLPVFYFILFKYVPMFGNILAFRRYRPAMGPYGTEWARPWYRYFSLFLNDPAFWQAFCNTLILSLLNLLINFPILILIFHASLSILFVLLSLVVSPYPHCRIGGD